VGECYMGGAGAQFAEGSYPGTGTSGESNPKTIPLPPRCKFLNIHTAIVTASGNRYTIPAVQNVMSVYIPTLTASYSWVYYANSNACYMKVVDNVLYMYGSSPATQFNDSTMTYYYTTVTY